MWNVGTNGWQVESKQRKCQGGSNTNAPIHTRTDTHHSCECALTGCIPACRGRPQTCDCVRGGIWEANAIWTEDPILRCQYSPHYLCTLLNKGKGKADAEQNINFGNADRKTRTTFWTTDTTVDRYGTLNRFQLERLSFMVAGIYKGPVVFWKGEILVDV